MKNLQIDTASLFAKTNLTWLATNTIYLTVHGSHAYGTNRPDSDIDLRGIAIPPLEYFLGVNDVFHQAEFSDPYDCVIFDIRKFFKLAFDCNPNVLELLFTDKSCHIKTSSLFDEIASIRDSFLSKKVRFTFAGYAHSQLKRIRRHRRWLQSPPKGKPSRSSDHSIN